METRKNLIKGSEKFQPERILVIANSGQGKTYWTSEFLKQRLQQKQFSPKRIVIISKTWRGDSSIARLIEICKKKVKRFEETNCFDETNQGIEFINTLFKTQKEMKDSGIQIRQWCVLLDDMIGEKFLYSDQFISTLSLCRHYGITIITLLQESKALSPKVLGQSSLLVLGRMSNQDRLESLLQEFNSGLGQTKKQRRDNILKWHEIAVTKSRFLLIRPHINYGEGKLMDASFNVLDQGLNN